jgi:hypothetical protein
MHRNEVQKVSTIARIQSSPFARARRPSHPPSGRHRAGWSMFFWTAQGMS